MQQCGGGEGAPSGPSSLQTTQTLAHHYFPVTFPLAVSSMSVIFIISSIWAKACVGYLRKDVWNEYTKVF